MEVSIYEADRMEKEAKECEEFSKDLPESMSWID